jgi:hypothetical protein
MDQIVKLTKRGVRVRLVLARYSDWPSYVLASEYLYDFFLKMVSNLSMERINPARETGDC